MGKSRNIFKKIGDTKGISDARMSMMRGSNDAEEFKKRWQKYTEELYQKDLHSPVNPDGVITHLEPNILEYKVKWALGSITMTKG